MFTINYRSKYEMEKLALLKCHRIMKKIIQRPISKLFTNDSEAMSIDVSQIQFKLLTNSYHSIEEYVYDMDKLFTEFDKKSTDYFPLKCCAEELQSYFRKQLSKLFSGQYFLFFYQNSLFKINYSNFQ